MNLHLFIRKGFSRTSTPLTNGRHGIPPVLPPFATADSPCFHSHSVWSCLLRCRLGFSILKRVLPSQKRTEFPPCGRNRPTATSQSPELGDLLLNSHHPF
jgi:hypothetical protein